MAAYCYVLASLCPWLFLRAMTALYTNPKNNLRNGNFVLALKWCLGGLCGKSPLFNPYKLGKCAIGRNIPNL